MEIEIEKYNHIKNRRKNLMSFVIFKMRGPYRSFDKYINYLKNLINNFYDKAKNADFDMRVYFDNSCKNEIKSLIEKYKQVEFYKFNYQPLRIGEFHNGTFGSIIRLLPIFNKEDSSYDYIWIDDIDIHNIDFTLMKIIKERNIKTFIHSMFCYIRPWIKSNTVLNFPLITNIKLDMNILTKYLNDIVNNKYKKIIDEIIKYRNDKFKYDYDVKFPYGMDEYFTNSIINDDLTKNLYIYKEFDISRMLKKIYLSNLIKDKRENDIVNELLKLYNILWKTVDKKIRNQIINTYIKLFNKIDKNNMQKYFILINSTDCLNEYYDYLNTVDLNTIDDFHNIIPPNN
jgi:hypothetical protein